MRLHHSSITRDAEDDVCDGFVVSLSNSTVESAVVSFRAGSSVYVFGSSGCKAVSLTLSSSNWRESQSVLQYAQ